MQLDLSNFSSGELTSICSGELTLTKSAAIQYMVYIIIMESITWCNIFDIRQFSPL